MAGLTCKCCAERALLLGCLGCQQAVRRSKPMAFTRAARRMMRQRRLGVLSSKGRAVGRTRKSIRSQHTTLSGGLSMGQAKSEVVLVWKRGSRSRRRGREAFGNKLTTPSLL